MNFTIKGRYGNIRYKFTARKNINEDTHKHSDIQYGLDPVM
jgi:hypothetical protein